MRFKVGDVEYKCTAHSKVKYNKKDGSIFDIKRDFHGSLADEVDAYYQMYASQHPTGISTPYYGQGLDGMSQDMDRT